MLRSNLIQINQDYCMPQVHTFTISTLQPSSNHPLLTQVHEIGFKNIENLVCQELYFIEGNIGEEAKKQLVTELFSDTVVQKGTWLREAIADEQVIEIALRPGVTDPVAEQILQSAKLLGISGITRAAAGQRFLIKSKQPLTEKELHLLTNRLLANPVIHHYAFEGLKNIFPVLEKSTFQVESIRIRDLNDQELLVLSQQRRTALDLAEMQVIQKYYQEIQRDPTDVELEMIAQTWSEHCCHKTFRADIQIETETIAGLLKTYIRAATEQINAPWVVSAFVDNAGIIEFDDEYQVAFKVETHNHPSAIEPFGGANTGLGGVIRDILGVSAKPIAATDIFCFGHQDIDFNSLPEGTLHPKRIYSGVVAGVQDYGNKTGIPTVNGAIWYDHDYTANPLVYCGCVGLIPKNKHPRNPLTGDRVIVLGGRTGRDGLRGATFSSMTMDAQTGMVAGASVQIGDPIIAKGLIEIITRARDLNLYHAVTDCGAGGLSSAVGEMASEMGAEVDISLVPLKYPGLKPWEIWLSEAQERMVLAVPAKHLPALLTLCNTFDIELTNIGFFADHKKIIVRYGEKIVLELANEFLHEGMPRKNLVAVFTPHPRLKEMTPQEGAGLQVNYSEVLLKLLSHPNIASKEAVIRCYDHEVQGGTIVKPLTGAENDGPSDASVLKPQGTKGNKGIVLANGLNPEIGKYDCYAMAVSAIDEAIRNAVATGADPSRIAILDNFCWGNPNRPETLGTLVDAARGCYDAAVHYRTPFISGKDSLNNEFIGTDGQRHAIPGTLLISAIGIIPDITLAVTMDFKKAGNIIYLLGETKNDFIGSHYALVGEALPPLSTYPKLPTYTPTLYKNLHQAMQKKLVRSCHDLSEGGLAVAIAEMCIAGRLGCSLNLSTDDAKTLIFSESNGRFLVEIEPENCGLFENYFTNQKELCTKIGEVTAKQNLMISQNNNNILNVSASNLIKAWKRE